jgi:molecular chaperone GrpE
MMVKKDKTEKEKTQNSKHHETTDSKINNTSKESSDNEVAEKPAESRSEMTDTVPGESEVSDADKIVIELASAQEKLAEMQDKYIRLSAEFDNYRKRTLREKMDMVKFADENLLKKLIPFMDDFDRALKSMEKTDDSAAVKNGLDLIYAKFKDFLNQNGVKEIEAINSIFDVDLHEAVAKVPVDDNGKKGKVVDVVLKGYFLQDKVLRFSKVVVGE